MNILQCSSYLISKCGFKVKMAKDEIETFISIEKIDILLELVEEFKKRELPYYIQGGSNDGFLVFTVWGFETSTSRIRVEAFEPIDAFEGLAGGTIQDCVEYIKVSTSQNHFNEQLLKRCLIYMGFLLDDGSRSLALDKVKVTLSGRDHVVTQMTDNFTKTLILSTDCILKVHKLVEDGILNRFV